MILKNYFKILAAYWGGATLKSKTKTVTGVAISPTAGWYSLLQFESYMKTIATTYSGGAVFGDGDTPVKVDDYCLSGNIITGITGSATRTNADDDDTATVSTVYTIINNNTDEVVIKEVAVCVPYHGSNYMIERTVLDSPVTIPAGGVGQITYTIRMNYPTV